MGAWLGNERLATSQTDRLEQALLATGFPADMQGREDLLHWWHTFSLRAHGLRRTGSTALNLAYLAAGRFDGYWAFDNHVWDVAAAVVLLREAGGVITNADGSPYDPYTPDAVASNGPLQPALLACFQEP
jgi:myo-inositol-1(or 4)-monophosphatase